MANNAPFILTITFTTSTMQIALVPVSRFFPFLLFAVLLGLLACESPPPEDTPTPDLTPRQAYLAALDSNGLGQTQMAQTWQQAGEKALQDSVLLDMPFQETGYFRAEVPAAFTYRLTLQTGELLHINLSGQPDSTLFFVDFFREAATDSSSHLEYLFSAENYQADSLHYEANQSGTYLLRLQPELLASGRFTIQLIVQPAYGVFPVSGKGNPDIWSSFGDPRDGGRRTHKGIDIFARRGTPTLASVDGVVRRVRDRGLGGKQVWLYDEARKQSLYYAHLDSQLVSEGQRVMAGDTLGTVGNTGNARTTSPHLHFSIYRRGDGAIDPKPFVAYRPQQAPRITADLNRLGKLSRVRQGNAQLRAAPHPRAPKRGILDRHFPLEIIAASKYWYRVRQPDGQSGYLPVRYVEEASRAIERLTIDRPGELRDAPHPAAAAVASLPENTQVDVIGSNGAYKLVRAAQGITGWMAGEDK